MVLCPLLRHAITNMERIEKVYWHDAGCVVCAGDWRLYVPTFIHKRIMDAEVVGKRRRDLKIAGLRWRNISR